MQSLLFALWFFLPAGIANSSPVFANKIPLLKTLGIPVDGGRTFRGHRIFGDHKTLRGFIVGVLSGLVVAGVQMLLYNNSAWIVKISGSIDYSQPIVLVMGAVMGFGALAGDAVKSFFKRQLDINSGQSWFPFDQIDYIIGGLLFSIPFVSLTIAQYFTIAIVWFLIHPVATIIGWLLKLKDSPI